MTIVDEQFRWVDGEGRGFDVPAGSRVIAHTPRGGLDGYAGCSIVQESGVLGEMELYGNLGIDLIPGFREREKARFLLQISRDGHDVSMACTARMRDGDRWRILRFVKGSQKVVVDVLCTMSRPTILYVSPVWAEPGREVHLRVSSHEFWSDGDLPDGTYVLIGHGNDPGQRIRLEILDRWRDYAGWMTFRVKLPEGTIEQEGMTKRLIPTTRPQHFMMLGWFVKGRYDVRSNPVVFHVLAPEPEEKPFRAFLPFASN